jgi:MFS family permease
MLSIIPAMSSKSVEESKWTSAHTWTFIAFSFGMLLEAYIYGLATFATGWYPITNTFLKSTILAWAPIWLAVGILFAGPISDRLGRKTTFYITMTLYAIGAIGIFFAYTYYLVLPFMAMLLFAAGGEMNTIMAANHELMPSKYRTKTMYWEINFINVGGVLLAIVAIAASASYYGSRIFQREMIGFTFVPILIVLIYSRIKMPESVRWLEFKGRKEDAAKVYSKYYTSNASSSISESDPPASSTVNIGSSMTRKPSVALRLFVTTAIATANAVGFGLMTYVLGPYYFPSLYAYIVLVANVVGFAMGTILGTMGFTWSRIKVLLYSSIGTAVVTYIIYALVPEWRTSVIFFWFLLVALNVFVGINYIGEDALKGEVWPTKHRGLYTAIPRVLSIGVIDTIAIYYTAGLSLSQYTLFNALIWTLGLVGAIVWWYRGNETGKGVSLTAASGEVLPT